MADRRELKGELALLEYVRRRTLRGRGVILGPGDDAAVLSLPPHALVFTIDTIVEGTDFTLKTATPYQIGWKAMACSLSDVAAMGCEPLFAVAAVSLTRRSQFRVATELHRGLQRCARAYKASLVGGDCSSYEGPLSLTVALIGRAPSGRRPILRSGARVGDAILVTGSLGGSLLGRHLSFRPRVPEALRLNRRWRIHAMIDLSDGLSLDLHRICQSSGVGAVLRAAAVPVCAAARRRARQTGQSALEHALSDGEDFELLFTCGPRQAERIVSRPPCGTRVSLIGRVVEKGYWIERADGRRLALRPSGWEHRFG